MQSRFFGPKYPYNRAHKKNEFPHLRAILLDIAPNPGLIYVHPGAYIYIYARTWEHICKYMPALGGIFLKNMPRDRGMYAHICPLFLFFWSQKYNSKSDFSKISQLHK